MRRLIKTAVHSFQLPALGRALSRRAVRILFYHRFDADRGRLEQQCEHIRRHYQPVGLQQVAEMLRQQRPLPPNAIAVTVDDGYRDFLLHGYPVFHKYDIPTTVFLVSDFLDRKLWLWTDIVHYVLSSTAVDHVTLRLPDSEARRFGLGTAPEREQAAEEICDSLKQVDNADRIETIDSLARELHVDVPALPPESCAPLAWDEVRQLAREGVEFGAHTRTHPILSRVSDPHQLDEEVLGSKARIEQELGRPVAHFCYPNGRRQDFTPQVVDVVARGGFQTAVTTERGLNTAAAQPLTLRRLGVGPEDPLPYFAELLSGLRKQ